MNPKPNIYTAENSSPFLGPKMLKRLANTDEFIYRCVFYPLIRMNDFDIYSEAGSRPATLPRICIPLSHFNSGIIQSLLDAEVTYRFKNGKHLWGYVLNAIEAANGKAHFVIASCLCPNNKTDSDMANELNRSVPLFFEEVDAVYAKYPALKKGDALHCQGVMQGILAGMMDDFIAEGEKPCQMSLDSKTEFELTAQLWKQMSVLDSFYDCLLAFDARKLQKADPAPAIEKAECREAKKEEKSSCSKAVVDWSRHGGETIGMNDPEFADLSDGERRNIILARISDMHGLDAESFVAKMNCVTDGAYSPSAATAMEQGINMIVTNLLGKKGNPISLLFNTSPTDGEKPTCPLGKEIAKTSERSNGTICVWMEQGDCEGCPCCKDCNARRQKRSGLSTITLNPHAFPAILSEALILTDRYQKFADFRNGSEALMSLFHNFHKCDSWPIGMAIKREKLRVMTVATNVRNMVLFIKDKTRVHGNPTVYAACRHDPAPLQGETKRASRRFCLASWQRPSLAWSQGCRSVGERGHYAFFAKILRGISFPADI